MVDKVIDNGYWGGTQFHVRAWITASLPTLTENYMVTIEFMSTPFSQRRKHISLWENHGSEINHLFDFQSIELSHDHLCNQVWKILSVFPEHEKTDLGEYLLHFCWAFRSIVFGSEYVSFFWIYFSEYFWVSVCIWLILFVDAFLNTCLNLFFKMLYFSQHICTVFSPCLS